MSAPNGVPLCVGAVLSTQHQTFAKVLARLPARKRVSAMHWGSAQRCTSTCFGSWTPTASPTSPSHLSHTSKPKQACELYGLVHNKLRAHVASCTRFAHLMTKLKLAVSRAASMRIRPSYQAGKPALRATAVNDGHDTSQLRADLHARAAFAQLGARAATVEHTGCSYRARSQI